MQGVEERDTQSGIHVFRVHYTADPRKRDQSVLDELAVGMPGGREGKAWKREMEIDWTVASGLAVYADNFVRDWHVSKQPLGVHESLPLYRGWDIGPTHVHPACVIAQLDPLGRLDVVDYVVSWDGRGEPKAVDIGPFAEAVTLQCNAQYPGHEWIDYADPAGWTKAMTDNKSAVMILNQHGIYPRKGPVTFTERKNAMVDRLSKQVNGRAAILVSNELVMLVEGFCGAYKYEEIGETGRFKATVDKNAWSHPMNALEYVVGGIYSPPVRERDEDERRRRSKRDKFTGY